MGSTPGVSAPEVPTLRSARLEDILSSDAVMATGILNDPEGKYACLY